jgi:translation initiation factor 2A
MSFSNWMYQGKNLFGSKSDPVNPTVLNLPDEISNPESPIGLFEISHFGVYVAVSFADHVKIYELGSWSLVSVVNCGRISDCYFSPRNRYFVTWANLGPRVEFSMRMFDVATGDMVKCWKIPNKVSWPMIQWTDDEAFCAMMESKGALNIYADNYEDRVERYSKKGLFKFKIAPGNLFRIAVFVLGKGNDPSRAAILEYPALDAPLSAISAFKIDDATITWNSLGTAITLQTTRDKDDTGKLYYGIAHLFVLRDDGFTLNLQQTTGEVPIHTVSWNPKGRQFAIIYGLYPDVTSALFNINCNKVGGDLTEEPRNKFIWSPCGRILCVGGFESLTGSMSFYNVSGSSPKLIGETTAFATSYHAFSPDGLYFMAATLSPKLRIDNGIKIFTYNGKLIFEEDLNDLYKAQFLPAPENTPKPAFDIEEVVVEKKNSPGIYRHPRFTQDNMALKQNQTKDMKNTSLDSRRNKNPIGYSEPVLTPPKTKTNSLVNRKKNLKKKLHDIEILITKQESGENLEKNQIDKIKSKGVVQSELDEIEQQLQTTVTNNF